MHHAACRVAAAAAGQRLTLCVGLGAGNACNARAEELASKGRRTENGKGKKTDWTAELKVQVEKLRQENRDLYKKVEKAEEEASDLRKLVLPGRPGSKRAGSSRGGQLPLVAVAFAELLSGKYDVPPADLVHRALQVTAGCKSKDGEAVKKRIGHVIEEMTRNLHILGGMDRSGGGHQE